jgi:glycosyltransferase involved in cell wall biosynthesis
MKKISIVTPCFNEELNVENCHVAVKKVMNSKLKNYDYEHIFADNCSTDGTAKLLREIASRDPAVKVIRNSRNVGPFRNMWNAMKSASGDAVIPLLPADLQDPPSVIPDFVSSWESGNLVVYGVRQNRQESAPMRMLRSFYYRFIRRFADADIPLNAGEFLLADRKVVDSVLSIDDEYPYIRGLIAQTAVKSGSVPYTWVRRQNGKSKNSLIDLFDQAVNGFVSTSRATGRITLLVGFTFAFLALLGALATFVSFLVNRGEVPVGIPTLIVTMFFFGGLQLLFLGLLGEYILSIHGQVRRTPPMFEVERINFESER